VLARRGRPAPGAARLWSGGHASPGRRDRVNCRDRRGSPSAQARPAPRLTAPLCMLLQSAGQSRRFSEKNILGGLLTLAQDSLPRFRVSSVGWPCPGRTAAKRSWRGAPGAGRPCGARFRRAGAGRSSRPAGVADAARPAVSRAAEDGVPARLRRRGGHGMPPYTPLLSSTASPDVGNVSSTRLSLRERRCETRGRARFLTLPRCALFFNPKAEPE
jgi:hypothetical protein